MDKIYVSIASYRDTELTDTVYNLLKQAKNPERIFLYIFSQDDSHPKLNNILDLFNVKDFIYNKVHFSEARGVGYARHITQKNLSLNFKYYLQIDSHTRFIKNWDEELITDYEKTKTFWKCNIIFSSYPLPYTYNKNGNEQLSNSDNANVAELQEVDNQALYKINYEEQVVDEYGVWHGHFCAGFAFGLSEYFLKVPYDPLLYFEGEEHLMSIRFFYNDIKIIAPYKSYCYHHYYGIDTRIKHWETDSNWGKYNTISLQRIKDFFEFKKLGIYGIDNSKKYEEWKNIFLKKNIG